jgi:hypothetical protein
MHTDSWSSILSRHLCVGKGNLRLKAYNTGADQRHNKSSKKLHGGSGTTDRRQGWIVADEQVPVVSRRNGNSRPAQFKECKGQGLDGSNKHTRPAVPGRAMYKCQRELLWRAAVAYTRRAGHACRPSFLAR